jgi:hypothetical protein
MIDIGANIGTTSLVRVIAGDSASTRSSRPANFACLVQNIVATVCGVRAADACAISSRTGPALLWQASGPGAHRLLDDKVRHGRRDSVRSRPRRSTTGSARTGWT